MADQPLVIRVAANLDTLRANLTEGVSQIETTSAAMRQMATAYDGSRAISQAGATMAAIQGIGGATNLTASEQAKANAILDAALEKYRALGKEAPPGMQALADAMRAVPPAANDAKMGATELKDALLLAFDHPIYALRDLTKNISTDLVSALGVGVVEGGVAAAALVGTFVLITEEAKRLVEHATEVGSSIYDASLKMTASVPAVSQLKFATEAAGGSLEQLASLAFVMQQRMEQNPTAFQDGLKTLKVNSDEFLRLDVDQRVLAISSAMRAAGDDTNLQATAMALFGRQGRDGLALLMKPLDDLVQKGRDLGFTWTEVDAKAADELAIKTRILGAEWDKLKTDIGVTLLPAMSALVDMSGDVATEFAKGADQGVAFDAIVAGLKEQFRAASATFDVFLGRTADVPKVTGDAAKGVKEWHQSLNDLQLKVASATNAVITEQTVSASLNEEIKKSIAEHERWQAVLDEVNSAGLGWQGTLDSIDGAVVEHMRVLTAAGVSLKTLETYYGLTATQGKAFADMLKDEAETLKIFAHIHEETFKLAMEHQKKWSEEGVAQTNRVNAAVLAELDAQVKLNAAAGESVDGQMKVSSASETLRLALEKLRIQKVEGISQDKEEQLLINAYTKSLYDEAVAQDAVTAALARKDGQIGQKPAHLNAQGQWVGDDEKPIGNGGANGGTGSFGFQAGGATDPRVLSLMSMGYTLGEAMAIAGGYGGQIGAPQTRDAGGPVQAGQSYYVGVRAQPELFTPSTDGVMTPAGAGGSTIVNHIYVTQPFGTPQAIADAVNKAQRDSLTNRGMRWGAQAYGA